MTAQQITLADGTIVSAVIPMQSIVAIESMPRVLEIAEQAKQQLTEVKDYLIDSPAIYEAAGEDLKAIKRQQTVLEELASHLMDPLMVHVNNMRNFLAVPKKRLEDAESTVKAAMLSYAAKVEHDAEVARQAIRDAQDKARRDAEQKAADDRRLAEETRMAAESLAATAVTPAELEQAQRALDLAQDQEQAAVEILDAVQHSPVFTESAPAAPALARIAGVSMRSTWKAIVDPAPPVSAKPEIALRLLVKAAAEDDQFLAYLQFNQKALDLAAKSQKGLMRIAGFKASEKKGMAASKR